MNDLNALVAFARVMEQGSFTAAGRLLSLPKTTVSRRVQELERRLGTALLQRTTRHVTPTEAGRVYYRHCERILRELELADDAVGCLRGTPRGVLHVQVPIAVGLAYLGPMLPEFMRQYPDVRVSVVMRNDALDPVRAGFDVALCLGRLADSSFAVRRLGSITRHLYASPAYIARAGMPVEPADLSRHVTLALSEEARGDRYSWQLIDGSESRDVAIEPSLVANDPTMVVEAALAGRGVAKLAQRLCEPALRNGRLVPVLPGWHGPPIDLSVLMPSRRGQPAKVRAFVDYIAAQFPVG